MNKIAMGLIIEGLQKSVNEGSDKKAMRENEKFKVFEKICSKYGYKLITAYVELFGNGRSGMFEARSGDKFKPEVVWDWKEDAWGIDTIAMGVVRSGENLEKYVRGINDAYKMIEELKKVNFDGLYEVNYN